jgi:ATP-dependent protease ClpP protease subunit
MQRRADDGLSYHSWFDNGLSIEGRIIVMESDLEDNEIDSQLSLHFIKCMTLLESMNDKAPICIILNSTGGDIFSSLAIYDRIIESPCQICIRGCGAVMSGASLIMQAATRRQMTPNTYMMIHDGTIAMDTDVNKAKTWVKLNDEMRDCMYKIYYNAAKKTNKKITLEQISNMCKEETWLSAQQALDIGLIDQIYKG